MCFFLIPLLLLPRHCAGRSFYWKHSTFLHLHFVHRKSVIVSFRSQMHFFSFPFASFLLHSSSPFPVRSSSSFVVSDDCFNFCLTALSAHSLSEWDAKLRVLAFLNRRVDLVCFGFRLFFFFLFLVSCPIFLLTVSHRIAYSIALSVGCKCAVHARLWLRSLAFIRVCDHFDLFVVCALTLFILFSIVFGLVVHAIPVFRHCARSTRKQPFNRCEASDAKAKQTRSLFRIENRYFFRVIFVEKLASILGAH